MFTERDHVCVCHGCGAFHVVRTAFLSSPLSIGFNSTQKVGRTWCVPAHACPACHAMKTERREDHPIAKAFHQGMSPEARARSDREFVEQWESKLEATKAAA